MTVAAVENAKQEDCEAAALQIEEETDSLKKTLEEYIAENKKIMRVEFDRLQELVTCLQDIYSPEGLRSLQASLSDLHEK